MKNIRQIQIIASFKNFQIFRLINPIAFGCLYLFLLIFMIYI